MARCDRNHNGIIDPEEREEALDNPDFVESQLETIDANHDGRLDLEELVYFDANANKILDPKEEAGIDLAEHLFADRLLKNVDSNGDGFLDPSEFEELRQSGHFGGHIPGASFFSSFPMVDANHDGRIDLNELETLLKQQTYRGKRSLGPAGMAMFNQATSGKSAAEQQQWFKTQVETYWRDPGSFTNRPPFNRVIRPGSGTVTNGAQRFNPQ